MKIKSLLFAINILLLLWIIFPFVFILLNQWWGLPVYIFGMFRLIGALSIIIGFVIALIASLTFMKFGKGTPAITQPPKKLVIKNLYKRTRNPIYIAHLLIYLGLFILFGHVLLLVLFIIGFIGLHLYLIKIEEPILKRRYGEDYLQYIKSIPRWF